MGDYPSRKSIRRKPRLVPKVHWLCDRSRDCGDRCCQSYCHGRRSSNRLPELETHYQHSRMRPRMSRLPSRTRCQAGGPFRRSLGHLLEGLICHHAQSILFPCHRAPSRLPRCFHLLAILLGKITNNFYFFQSISQIPRFLLCSSYVTINPTSLTY